MIQNVHNMFTCICSILNAYLFIIFYYITRIVKRVIWTQTHASKKTLYMRKKIMRLHQNCDKIYLKRYGLTFFTIKKYLISLIQLSFLALKFLTFQKLHPIFFFLKLRKQKSVKILLLLFHNKNKTLRSCTRALTNFVSNSKKGNEERRTR